MTTGDGEVKTVVMVGDGAVTGTQAPNNRADVSANNIQYFWFAITLTFSWDVNWRYSSSVEGHLSISCSYLRKVVKSTG